MGEFGDKFRQAREKKELSLDDVSNVTKISSRMLQAIEEEHFDQLPGGVFNKGFIRAYAKHLGLDSEDAVSDYLACLRQAQIDSYAGWDGGSGNGRGEASPSKSPQGPSVKTTLKPHQPDPSPNIEELPDLHLPRADHVRGAKKEYLSRKSSGTPWALIAAVALVIVLGMLFWIRRSRTTHEAPTKLIAPPVAASAPAPTTTAPTTSAPASSAPSPSVATTPVAAPARPQATTSPAPAVAANPTSSAPTAPDPQQSTDPDDLPVARASKSGSTVPTPDDPNQVKVQKKGDVTIRSFGATPSQPADKAAASLTLVVRASENSWISVTSDGQLLTQETLIAPAATSFHASRELVVRVGNAAGISFLWQGEELPPQGAEAEAKTFTFDAQGMHTSPPAQPSAQN